MKTKTKQECQIVQTKKKKPQISNSHENDFKRNSLKVEAKNEYLENEITIIYCTNYIKSHGKSHLFTILSCLWCLWCWNLFGTSFSLVLSKLEISETCN